MKILKNSTLLVGASLMATIAAADMLAAQELRVWTTETQPARLERQQKMAADYEAATGVKVEMIPVDEQEYGTRATAAFAAGDLPDVIYYPLQYALPWTEAGILDAEAAQEVLEELGTETFAPGPINMAQTEDGVAGVPVDGWTQMIVYRKDLFEENDLEPPTSYANVLAAVEALHNPPEMFGFVAATKVDEGFMSQVLEHVLLANGATPVDENGFKGFDEANTIEALEFYKAIAEASPPGELFWKQSRELYFAGQAAMIIWSPFIMDELAGLRDAAPVTINDDPTSRELANATGFVTNFSGPSNPDGAAWADSRYFGITADADTETAQDFVRFAVSDGYMDTLAIAPEGKFPSRNGTADNPTTYIDGWSKLDVGVDRRAPLSELYDAAVIDNIVAGLDVGQRWGVAEGQLGLASKIINSQAINRVVREYIDGDIDAAAAVAKMNEELASIE
ncbi:MULTISPECIES: ABC transporter substrate-binding protein [unclassified Ruegeria]|uniref:ABC transporter substrate-binding protein n=1 Tax=unclassified Ruegeria TaxID=2625375 RepID=UPI0014881648|nr:MULTISPECIES: extracellular solute-binding protein [unclassified Ruegeria]